MKKVLIAAAAGLLFAFVVTMIMRAADRDAPSSDRITGVAEEFLERSLEVRASWTKFQECRIAGMRCNLRQLLAQRDVLESWEWPGIFDRLIRRDNWGTSVQARANRDNFFHMLEMLGAEKLREHCAPRIAYYRVPHQGVVYVFEGYRCGYIAYTPDGRIRFGGASFCIKQNSLYR